MKTIIVGFSKSKKKFPIASWLIRLYQQTPFSHTYIRIRKMHQYPTDTILHASEGKVQYMSEQNFNKRHQPILEVVVPVTEEQYEDAKLLMHNISGDDYSILQNVGILLVDMLKLININISNPFQKGWNCSEFVATLLKETGILEFKNLKPNTVTPKDIYKKIAELPVINK